MPKQCNHKGCTFNQFGGGYCRNHQWLRTDKKRKPKPKRTPIRKRSIKQTKLLGERKLLQTKDWEFYLEIWDERDHICFETDQYLGNEPQTLFFHHVLEKGIRRYKKYRHCKWNIVLISWQVHDQVGMDIDRCPKIKAYHDKLLKQIEDGTIDETG
jgi:hypothetical protein